MKARRARGEREARVACEGRIAKKIPPGFFSAPTLGEFVNHSPEARDLRILLVFYQHPAWFISL